jgi:hypothetical protein
MQDTENAVPTTSKRLPWNKGKLTGAKPPLRPKHVWSIRTKLQVEGRIGDVQSGHRQQAAWLRCHCPQGRGCCTERVFSGSGDGAAEEDRVARQV